MTQSLKHYENKHRNHKIVFATALTIAILSFLGIILFVSQVQGETSLFSLTINGPETVTSLPAQRVEEEPTGASAPLNFLNAIKTVEDPISSQTGESVAIRLTNAEGVTPTGGTLSSTERQEVIPILTTSEVEFSGVVSTPDSLVFIELHPINGTIYTSTLKPDVAGYWSWTPANTLSNGEYVLYVYVFDTTGQARLAEADFAFEIRAASTNNLNSSDPVTAEPLIRPRTAIEIPPALLELRKVLFDIRAEILTESEPAVINPGDNLLAQISLLNIGSPGFIVDTKVNYRLVNPDGDTVFEEEETVSVSTQTSYLKRFSTGPGLAEGNYRFIASVTYEDTQAVAFDEFRISGPSVVTLPGAGSVNVTLILQILVGIFALAVLITYLEYRNIQLLGKIIHQVTARDLDQKGFFVK